MNNATGCKKLVIKPHEFWMGQSFFCLSCSQLRIRKGDPDLLYFIFPEVLRDPIDLNPQERDIWKVKLQSFLCSHPDPVTFLVNTNKIVVRIKLSKTHSIFTFSAC